MTRRIAGLAAAVLVSGGMSLTAFGVGVGVAHAIPLGDADTGGTWCPGQPVPGGFTQVNWDWNICHNYYLQITGTPPEIVGMKIETGARSSGCWPTVAGVSTNRTADFYCGFPI